jgi:class I fructose-bisphosphate aldolase
MRLTRQVKEILSWYESDTPGVRTFLARLLMHARLAGSGNVVLSSLGTRW